MVRAVKLTDLKADGRVIFAPKCHHKELFYPRQTADMVVYGFSIHLGLVENFKPESRIVPECQVPFHINLDETCIMGSEGTTKVIGDATRKKQDNNREYNRDSITVV